MVRVWKSFMMMRDGYVGCDGDDDGGIWFEREEIKT